MGPRSAPVLRTGNSEVEDDESCNNCTGVSDGSGYYRRVGLAGDQTWVAIVTPHHNHNDSEDYDDDGGYGSGGGGVGGGGGG